MRGCSCTGGSGLWPALLDADRSKRGAGAESTAGVATASLWDGDGGDVDIGDREAAYCELEYDMAGEPLVDETEAKGDDERRCCGDGSWRCEAVVGE